MNTNFLMSMLSGGGTPEQIAMNFMQQNPRCKPILNQQKQSGMSWEQYTRQYAKQNNIDINPMINALKQRGFRF